jgi:hypothetical protein
MSSSRVQANPQSTLPFGEESKPGFRTKTAATRLTPEELGEIEAAAESAGQALSEWLRGTALCAARQRPADPAELVLAEVWALRYALLNLFHAASQAASEGSPAADHTYPGDVRFDRNTFPILVCVLRSSR